MFGIGGGEFLVIALVALIAVGPEQLPSVMRKFGSYVAQLRSMADGVRGEFMAGVEELDPVKWTGDGSDEKPIVPRGFAESATTTLGTPVAKPKTTPMAANDTIDQAFGKSSDDAESAQPAAADSAADASAPPVNAIAAANARPTPEPEPDADDPSTGAGADGLDAPSTDDGSSDDVTPEAPAAEAAVTDQEPPAS